MRIWLHLALWLGFGWAAGACLQADDELSCGPGIRDASAVVQGNMPRPAFGQQVHSAGYGVCLTRLTDHVAHANAQAVHVGAGHQAFNADETLLMLRDGHVVRADDGAAVARLPQADGVWLWSSVTPQVAHAVRGHQLLAYDLVRAEARTLRDFAGSYARLLAETALGEPSTEGAQLMLGAQLDQAAGAAKVMLRVSLADGQVLSATPVEPDEVGRFLSPRWLQVLPDGRGFLAGWPRANAGQRFAGVELFDEAGRFVRQVDAQDSGGAVARDATGAQWFVHVLSDAASGHRLVKTPLTTASGALSFAAPQPLLWLNLAHSAQVSCLSWGHDHCVMAINAEDESVPLDGEIVRVSLASRPEAPVVERLVKHHSAPEGVFVHSLERCPLAPAVVLPHPTLDRSGGRVLFASNWGEHCFAELYMLRLF